MTIATAEINPLRGHIVSFPKAIPSARWMAQRVLWADHVGAVWPAGFPTDMSHEDREALEAAEMYRAAKLFTPCGVPHDPSATALRRLQASLRLPEKAAGQWLAGFKTGVFDNLNPDRVSIPDSHLEGDQYFYINKFPPKIQQALLRSGVASKDNDFLVIRTAEKARALLAALAEHAEPYTDLDLPLVLDASDSSALARAAAPTKATDSRPAVLVDVPVLAGVTMNAEKLIAYRNKQGTDQAREDYLDAVAAYVTKIVKKGSNAADPAKVAGDRVLRDLDLASKSWRQRAVSAGIGGPALTTISALAPLPDIATPSDWLALAAGGLGAGAVTAVAIRKSHVHGYLTRARSAGAFDSPSNPAIVDPAATT